MSNVFGMKEVLDFTVEKYSSTATRGDLLFKADYATETTLSTKATRLDVRGGQGNYKLMSFDHSKECTYKATLPLIDIKALATKLGRTITTGASKAPITETLVASASNTITLTKAPLASTLKIYLLNGERDFGVEQTVGTPATEPNTYSIAESVVTLNTTTAPAGTKFIASYSYTTGVTSDNIKLTANDFPFYIRITGRGFGTDKETGLQVPMTFDIKKAKVTCDFDFTMTEDKATELAFECDCYTVLDDDGKSQVYAEINKINDEAV